mmetsp:Transcript_12071/g.34140  ORF Transcript_12071/g.34140 Transcript_12071/m.34140 type:complete len:252 (+) Transcript_12071:488-1243(+)
MPCVIRESCRYSGCRATKRRVQVAGVTSFPAARRLMKVRYSEMRAKETGSHSMCSRYVMQRGTSPGKEPFLPSMISCIVISTMGSSFTLWKGRLPSWMMFFRNQNLQRPTASGTCARAMFSSTLDRGTRMSRSKTSSARVTRTMKAVNAAFSKSVSWTSIERNSVRQPMCGAHLPSGTGGGFQRTVCQFVELMLSKCSTDLSSFTSWTLPSKATRGSRTKRCARWCANGSSIPLFNSVAFTSASISQGTSL